MSDTKTAEQALNGSGDLLSPGKQFQIPIQEQT